MLRLNIFILFFLFTRNVNGQVSSAVDIDTSSREVAILVNNKKLDVALSLLNKLINKDSTEGVNFFNRAVLNYYKNPKPKTIHKINGKTVYFDSYDTAVVNDCKRAEEKGYITSELYYLIFLEYYNYCHLTGGVSKGSHNDNYGYKYIGYKEQKEFLDNALNISWSNKYITARFQLYINYGLFPETFNIHSIKAEFPNIESDSKNILEFTKDKKTKFFANYYLSSIYLIVHNDTLKAINYLSRAIEINPFNPQNTSKREFNTTYDNLYAERGKLKFLIQNYEGAIEDFNIHLSRWEDPKIYDQRGWSYLFLLNSTNSLKDANKEISLYEEQRTKLLKSGGHLGYDNLEADYLESQLGDAYYLRAVIFLNLLHNKKEALRDLYKASEYGHSGALIIKNELLQDIDSIQDDTQPTEIFSSDNSIPMVKKGGVYEIPITINGSLKINFIFDAGASDVSISADVALTLIRTGTVTDKDFIGTQTYKFADGSTAKSKVFLIKELQIGSRKVTNVRATISNSLDAPLLLGQSALNRFGKITIDYKNGVIHFED